MQSSTKIIIRSFLLIPILAFLCASCLKKLDAADEIDTNIFDREYAGDIWYAIADVEQVTNELGQIKARLTIFISEANLPGLVPSNLKIQAEGDGLAPVIVDFPLVSGGNFERAIDLPYTGTGEYCVKLGIYVEEDDEAINLFDACTTL